MFIGIKQILNEQTNSKTSNKLQVRTYNYNN